MLLRQASKRFARTQGIGMFAPVDFQDLLEGMDPRVRRATKETKEQLPVCNLQCQKQTLLNQL